LADRSLPRSIQIGLGQGVEFLGELPL